MEGFNPLIDAAILTGFLAVITAISYVGHRYGQYKKSKLRGATRV